MPELFQRYPMRLFLYQTQSAKSKEPAHYAHEQIDGATLASSR